METGYKNYQGGTNFRIGYQTGIGSEKMTAIRELVTKDYLPNQN